LRGKPKGPLLVLLGPRVWGGKTGKRGRGKPLQKERLPKDKEKIPTDVPKGGPGNLKGKNHARPYWLQKSPFKREMPEI